MPSFRNMFPDAEAVFNTSLEEFKESLSEEDRVAFQTCRSAEELIGSIQGHITNATLRYHGRLLTACKKIDAFGQTLQAFFQIVDIFVSSNPEWAAIAWGALRLIFKISSHYVTFFERLADMFEKMALILPDYSRQMNLLVARAGISAWRPSHERLTKSLSYIYTDIMQFCNDACRLFSSKRRGIKFKVRVIFDPFWIPFDKRFESILSRFQEHTRLFNRATREVLTEEVLLHFNIMDHEIEERTSEQEQQKEEKDRRDKEALLNRLRELRTWIASPNWASIYEAAERCRSEDTGTWILKHNVYQAWLADKQLSPVREWKISNKTLLISGKPGYGKTVLSTRIIDHLRESTSRDCVTVYFHFDQQNTDLQTNSAALRAMITQILHACHDQKNLIDVASIVLNDTGIGQREASAKEIRAILSVYVNHFSPLYLVVDGLDECSDWEIFLRDLEEICCVSDCKIILLARPHLYSSKFKRMPYQINLGSQDNLEDIKRYLQPRIECMLQSNNSSGNHSTNAISSEIAHRANSMFLWAVLMSNYLSVPSLSLSEWYFAVDNLNLFEGLEALYGKILEDIQRRMPRSQWPKVHSIFQWLAVQKDTLTVDALQTALATRRDRSTVKEDYIPNFEESLSYISGSLVEVGADRSVRFIHLSVSEFLTKSISSDSNSYFDVDIKDAHFSMAMVCLSYMMHNVEHKPLSGCDFKAADKEIVTAGLPFLRYAAIYWDKHATDYLYLSNFQAKGSLESNAEILLDAISRGIVEKLLVTVWIEACWLFNSPPNIFHLHHQIKGLKGLERSFTTNLKHFASSISCLEKSWGHFLSKASNEIWLPSINSISKSEFWVGTEQASATPLTETVGDGAIIIASQVSSSGQEIGIVKLWPLSVFSILFTKEQQLKGYHRSIRAGTTSTNDPAVFGNASTVLPNSDSKLCYQIWSLKSMDPILDINLDIPSAVMEEYRFPGLSVGYDHFRFPVTISSSLRSIVVLGTVCSITDSTVARAKFEYHTQLLRVEGCPHNPVYEALLGSKGISRYFGDFTSADFRILSHREHGGPHECYKWYQYQFSLDEKYLILIEGGGPPQSQALRPPLYNSYIISAHHNSRYGEPTPAFCRLSSVAVRCDMETSNPLCIHPFLPLLAVCTPNKTLFWNFKTKESHLVECFESSLRDLTFSDTGHYLMGRRKRSDKLVVLEVVPFISKYALAISETDTRYKITSWECQISQLSADNSARVLANMYQSSSSREGPIVTSASTMSLFKNPQGDMNVSTVRYRPDLNAVTHEITRSNRSLVQQTVTLLPKSSTLDKNSPTLIMDAKVSSNTVRLVLNMAAQESYSASERSDFSLPFIIDRAIDSMPTSYVETVHRMPHDNCKIGQDTTLHLEDSRQHQSGDNGKTVHENT